MQKSVPVLVGAILLLGGGSLLLGLWAGPGASAAPPPQATSTLAPPTPTPPQIVTLAPRPTSDVRPIALNSHVENELSAGSWDVWTFEGQADQVVTITLNSLHFDAFLELYTPGDTLRPFLANDDGGRVTNAQLAEVVLPITGTYEIHVRAVDDDGSGAYRLFLEAGRGLGMLTGESLPLLYSAIERGMLDDFADLYHFDGQAGEAVTLTLASETFDAYLVLMADDGEIIIENDDNGQGGRDAAIANLSLPYTGRYYIVVEAYDTNPHGPYNLALYETSRPVAVSGGVLDIGTTARGNLTPNSYADWRFTGQEGQIISATAMTDPFGARLNLYLELYGPDGSLVEADNDSGLILNAALTDIRLPADGEYRLRVFEATPIIGGDYVIGLAEGRAYFGPGAEVVPLVFLSEEGAGFTPVEVLADDQGQSENLAVWLVAGVTEAPLTITLLTSGGQARLDDFVLRVFDTDWVQMADSHTGVLSLEELSTFSSEYLVLVEYEGRRPLDYQLIFQAGDAPFVVPSPSAPSITPTPDRFAFNSP